MAVTLNASTSSGLVQTADTSGTIELQSNGTTKATVSSSGLAIGQYNPSTSLVTSSTAVSASNTSVDFTSIPSWVKRITVMFDGVSTNGTSNLLIQIGSGSVLTSGYGSSAGFTGTSTGGSSSTAGFVITAAIGSTNTISGANTICLLGSNTYVSTGNLIFESVSPILFIMSSAGVRASVGGAIDRVRITTVNGTDTFDAGTINILYE
jgi:hypothetical protein